MRKSEIEWLLREKYFGKPSMDFKKDVEKLYLGEPLGYVIGFVEFLGCKIDLSERTLIPRPETEYWSEQAIEKIKQRQAKEKDSRVKILDLFSGSGCIGIAVLKCVENSEVIFSDKSEKSIKQIKKNIKINLSVFASKKTKTFMAIKSDVFKQISGKFDYIFANPPYIPKTKKNKIHKSVLGYEPKCALFGGKDGIFYIKKFLKEAMNYLNFEGKIFMEFDCFQKREIENLLKKSGYENWEFHRDQYGKWRWVETG